MQHDYKNGDYVTLTEGDTRKVIKLVGAEHIAVHTEYFCDHDYDIHHCLDEYRDGEHRDSTPEEILWLRRCIDNGKFMPNPSPVNTDYYELI